MNCAFSNQLFRCRDNGGSRETELVCPLYGRQIVEIFGYSTSSATVSGNVLGLLGAIVALRVVGVLALKRSLLPPPERRWLRCCGKKRGVVHKRNSIIVY